MSHSFAWMASMALILAFHGTQAMGASVHIFHVQKNLAQSAKDPVYKDYYLSAGQDYGLKEKMILSVVRSTPVFDHSRDLKQGEMKLRMGQLKVIYVGDKMSVARFYQAPSRAELPTADIEGFLLGDQIDLSDAYMEPVKAEPVVIAAPKLEQTVTVESKPAALPAKRAAARPKPKSPAPVAASPAPAAASSAPVTAPPASVAASPSSIQVPIVEVEDESTDSLEPLTERLEPSIEGVEPLSI